MTDRVVSYAFRANFAQFAAGLTTMGRGVNDLGVKLTALDRNGAKMRQGLDTLGRGAGKVGLVAAAGLGAAVLASANFEQAMSRIDAATHETAQNMGLLRAAAIKAGADTVFSAGEAADAITALAKAGVSTKDILGGALSASLSLASAGELDVAQAADIAATALNQFGLGGDQASHVADLLAAGAGKAQGEVTDMAAALKYVGPVAHQMGISIEETSGTIAELAAQGILGEQAGTSLRGMLTALTSPSQMAAAEMKKYNITLYDAQGQFVGLSGVAGQLQTAFGSLGAEERDQALGRIFGNEQITTARILYAGGAEAVKKWTAAVDADGYAADTAARKLDNLKGDLEQLKGSLETALIGAGDGSQGPLRKLAQGTTDVVNGLNAIPGPAKNVATGLLAITAITGGGLWFGSKVVGGIAAAKGALAALGLQAGTTRAALSSLGVVGASTAIGLGTLLDSLSLLDSRSRSRAASDATVKSFQDLNDALSASNVGKYASDLGIDIGRLSQELLDSGTSGEYVQKVLDDLAEHSHGVGAAVNSLAGNVLPFFTAGADKAYDANKDLNNIIDASGDVLGSTATQTVKLADGTEMLGTKAEIAAAKIQMSAKDLEKLHEEAIKTGESFFGLGDSLDDSKVSLAQWTQDLRDQAKALEDFTANARTAGKRGLREGLIAELEAAGPAGALRMKQLADGTDAEIRRANRAWARGQRAIADYVAFKVPAKNVDVNTAAAVQKLNNLLGLLSRVGGFDLGSLLKGKPSLSTPKNADGTPDHDGNPLTLKGKAAGGRIDGPGTKTSDSVLIRASAGEFMQRAAAVDYYGLAFMDDVNNLRVPKYANGGAIGGGSGLGNYIRNDLDLKYPATLRQWTLALEKSRQTVKSETDQRQNLIDLRDSTSSAVRGNLRSDLFGKSDASVWMSAADRANAGTGDLFSTLTGDISNINAEKAAIAALMKKHLDGGALAELLTSGSLADIQGLANASQATVDRYESLYNQRERGLVSVGNAAGSAVASPSQLAALNRQLAESKKFTAAINRVERLLTKNPHATGREVARAINGAGPKRPRRGN